MLVKWCNCFFLIGGFNLGTWMLGVNLGNQLYFITTSWITYLKLLDEPFAMLDELKLGLVSVEAPTHDSHAAQISMVKMVNL
jgi:hypothetical protein